MKWVLVSWVPVLAVGLAIAGNSWAQEEMSAPSAPFFLFGSGVECVVAEECGVSVCYQGACRGLLEVDALWAQEMIGDALLESMSSDTDVKIRVLDTLIGLASDPTRPAHHRSRATSFLSRIDDSRVPPLLQALLGDRRGGVAMRARLGLAHLGDKDSLEVVTAWLDSPSETLQVLVVRVIGKGGGHDSTSTVASIARAHDRAAVVRLAAMEALGRLGGSVACGALIEILEDSAAGYLHHGAMKALEAATGRQMGLDTQSWRRIVSELRQ